MDLLIAFPAVGFLTLARGEMNMADKWRAFGEIVDTLTDNLDHPLTDDGIDEFTDTYKDTVGEYIACTKKPGEDPPDKDYWEDPKFKKWTLRCVVIVADFINREVQSGAVTHRLHVRDGVYAAFKHIKDKYCAGLPKCGQDATEATTGPVCALYFDRRKPQTPHTESASPA
jgi:hypothetical protein